MFHNQISSALRSSFFPVSQTSNVPSSLPPERSLRLVDPLVSLADTARVQVESGWVLTEVVSASAKRFAAFCAEASVLVFVLGILDRFLLKQRIEMGWVAGAFVASVILLGLSVATDVVGRRWLSRGGLVRAGR